jgi:pimeloyl-ACP methyl ester carboxylesterase
VAGGARNWVLFRPEISMSEPSRFPGTDRAILLHDGRMLGYAEYGDPSGLPVFYFHGWPSCRIEGRLIHSAATAAGVRLLAVDRPGFGLSDPRPGLSLLAWPDDVLELADALRIGRFAILGVSSGAPWALACGHRMPDRISSIALVGGVGPLDDPSTRRALEPTERALHQVAMKAPLLLRGFLAAIAYRIRRDPSGFIASLALRQPASDRAYLDRPEIRETVATAMREAIRNGTGGLVDGAAVQARPWGFRLADVPVKVHLWHGEKDATVSADATRHLAAGLPVAEATFLPGESHLGTLVGHAPGILRKLVDETMRSRPAA